MTYPYTLTIAALRKMQPCTSSFARISAILPKRGKIDPAHARAAGCTYDDIIWAASTMAAKDESLARRLTGYLNDNAKRVLHIWEETTPDDTTHRVLIATTDAWLAGEASEDEWKLAAWDARAARAARDAWAAWDAWAARDARAARDTWAAEFQAWQFDRLIYWLTEVEPVCLPMPALHAGEAELTAMKRKA